MNSSYLLPLQTRARRRVGESINGATPGAQLYIKGLKLKPETLYSLNPDLPNLHPKTSNPKPYAKLWSLKSTLNTKPPKASQL